MNEPNPQLEELLHRKLRELPDRRAPRTLAPRVMAAIRQRQALAWYQRSWTTWPRGLQIAAMLLFAALGVLVFTGLGPLTAGFNLAWVSSAFAWVSGTVELFWSVLGAVAGAVPVVLRNVNQLLLLAVAGTAFALYLSCIGMGTAFYRLVLKPAHKTS